MPQQDGFPTADWISANSVILIQEQYGYNTTTTIITIGSAHGIVVAISLDCNLSSLVKFDTNLLHQKSTMNKAKAVDLI